MILKELLDQSKTIGVISHVNPDADNLGSLTALSNSLELYGKDVTRICIDTVPYNLEFLYGIDKITDSWDKPFDMLFILDTSSLDRLGKAKEVINNSKLIVNIDHHISNNLEADYSFLEVTASSTGEVLFKFLKNMNLPIDKNVADSLLTAISGDSGSFRYDTVTSLTFDIASELLSLGADQKMVNNNLYGMNRMSKIKMMGRAIERLRIFPEKNLGLTYILLDDFEELDAVNADVEGIVEYIRDIDGIEIAILLRENNLGFKASTRSKKYYDVSELALRFDGGGHIRAAGFTILKHDLEEAIEDLLNKI